MAPTRAHSTTTRAVCDGTSWRSTIEVAMVSATSVPSRAPVKFMTAAMSRAARGVSARVETDVAIALAASWNPFV
ncbi:hypothetical protein D3C74_307090 [compost metagenome]